jgi:hypothetical protein
VELQPFLSELPEGHCQKIDHACASYKCFISVKGSGSLPVYKESAAVVPVAGGRVFSSFASSFVNYPLACSPRAAAPFAAASRKLGFVIAAARRALSLGILARCVVRIICF